MEKTIKWMIGDYIRKRMDFGEGLVCYFQAKCIGIM